MYDNNLSTYLALNAEPHVNSQAQSQSQAQAQTTARASRELQPMSAITDLLDEISHPALRCFMDRVLCEPEIQGLVTLPLVRLDVPLQFPIQLIRRVGAMLSATQARTRQEKDILLVATVLWGIRSLLPLSMNDSSDVQDVFFTLIRPALLPLDDATCEVSGVLRCLIGFGDETAMQSDAIDHLQRQIQRAIGDMHRGKHWIFRCMREAIERQTLRGVKNFVQPALPS